MYRFKNTNVDGRKETANVSVDVDILILYAFKLFQNEDGSLSDTKNCRKNESNTVRNINDAFRFNERIKLLNY
jgi:hypothetical protein